MEPGKEFSVNLRVYIEDTDAGGIVYYVNYLKFMERARTEFMRELGYGKAAVLEENMLFVVQFSNIKYLSPARLDDEVLATARPVKVGPASVLFEQRVLRGQEELCCGEIRIACVDAGDMKPVAMPEEMYARLQAAVQAG